MTASGAVDSHLTTAVHTAVCDDDEGGDLSSFDQKPGDSAPTSNLSVNKRFDGTDTWRVARWTSPYRRNVTSQLKARPT
eukprot:scaffold1057_cov203-Skeletonema_marinoi.AAC.17